jgi:FKBP-type peptidyl-prolyl cis-trans isomerase
MPLKLRPALVLSLLLAFSTHAQESKPGPLPSGPPDKDKVSYALGMNMAMDLKPMGVELDASRIGAAFKDVMEGKPTELKESELMEVFNQARVTGLAQQAAKDKGKVSYALGMRLAVQLKRAGADVDGSALTQGVTDVMEGKPTKVQAAEIPSLFQQAQAYGLTRLAQKNKGEGVAFLAKNAKVPGITVLPSGLQYRVLEPGGKTAPTTNDLIFVKYRGSLLDGREFDHNDQYLIQTTGGIKGWQEALQRMKVGSKWQLFVPPDIGFGHEGEPARQVGPDATLIYEMELLEIAKPGDPRIGTGRIGHGLNEDLQGPAATAGGQGAPK